jgi:hypothetical protein
MAQDDEPLDDIRAVAMTAGAAVARVVELAVRNAQDRARDRQRQLERVQNDLARQGYRAGGVAPAGAGRPAGEPVPQRRATPAELQREQLRAELSRAEAWARANDPQRLREHQHEHMGSDSADGWDRANRRLVDDWKKATGQSMPQQQLSPLEQAKAWARANDQKALDRHSQEWMYSDTADGRDSADRALIRDWQDATRPGVNPNWLADNEAHKARLAGPIDVPPPTPQVQAIMDRLRDEQMEPLVGDMLNRTTKDVLAADPAGADIIRRAVAEDIANPGSATAEAALDKMEARFRPPVPAAEPSVATKVNGTDYDRLSPADKAVADKYIAELEQKYGVEIVPGSGGARGGSPQVDGPAETIPGAAKAAELDRRRQYVASRQRAAANDRQAAPEVGDREYDSPARRAEADREMADAGVPDEVRHARSTSDLLNGSDPKLAAQSGSKAKAQPVRKPRQHGRERGR